MRTLTRTIFVLTLVTMLLGCENQPAGGPDRATDATGAPAAESADGAAEAEKPAETKAPGGWKETARQGWQNAKDVAAETRDAAAETAEKVTEKVKEANLDQKAKELAVDLTAKAGEALEDAGEALQGVKERYSGEVYDPDHKPQGPSYTGTRNNPDILKD